MFKLLYYVHCTYTLASFIFPSSLYLLYEMRQYNIDKLDVNRSLTTITQFYLKQLIQIRESLIICINSKKLSNLMQTSDAVPVRLLNLNSPKMIVLSESSTSSLSISRTLLIRFSGRSFSPVSLSLVSYLKIILNINK